MCLLHGSLPELMDFTPFKSSKFLKLLLSINWEIFSGTVIQKMDSTLQNCNGIVWRQTVRQLIYNLVYRFRLLFLQLKLTITPLKSSQIKTNQIKTCQKLYRDSIMLLVTDSIDWNSDRVGHKTIVRVLHRRTYPKDVHSYRHFLRVSQITPTSSDKAVHLPN